MYNRILICGLPNSGKTTFAKSLVAEYQTNNKPYVWLNGDDIRSIYKDWDFSMEGRLRQTQRLIHIATKVKNKDVIIDYVCPLEIYRQLIRPTHTVYINTGDTTPYEDTKKLFEAVANPTMTILNKNDIPSQAKQLFDQLKM